MARDSRGSGSSSSSASEESGVEEKPRRKKKVLEGSESRYGEVQDEAGTRAGCREPGVVLRLARRIAISSDFEGPGGIGACKIYSSENGPAALVETNSSERCLEDVTGT